MMHVCIFMCICILLCISLGHVFVQCSPHRNFDMCALQQICMFICMCNTICKYICDLKYVYVMIFACFKNLSYAVFLTRAADHEMPIIRHFGWLCHIQAALASVVPLCQIIQSNQFDKINLRTSHHHKVFSNDQITATKNVHDDNDITQ